MLWEVTHRNDARGRALADRHYSRQKIGAPGYTPPGRVLVLVTPEGNAVWATSAPYAQYAHRVYPDAWVCSLFRNESPYLASELIRDAIAASVWRFGTIPDSGMVTMIDDKRVRPTMVRGTPVYGWTYRRAGFQEVGRTVDRGLLILQLHPEDFPEPEPPLLAQLRMAL